MFDRSATMGRFLRRPLDAIPEDRFMPVLAGPARGLRWQRGAGIHAAWLGTYEREKVSLFKSLVNQGDLVFDIGAHAGYFTLLAAKHGATVVAVEPDPTNVSYLERHISRNGFSQSVIVVPAVVGGMSGQVEFVGSGYVGQVGKGGRLVRSVTLDWLLSEFGAPSLIKMDIEGAEADALGAADRLLATGPSVLLATHGDSIALACRALLESHDYIVRRLDDPREFVALRREHGG